MSNFYRDNDDLQFYLERGVDWEPIVELTENGFSYEDGFDDTEEAIDFYESVLEMVGRFVAEEVAPHAMEMDREGLELVDGEVEEPEVFDQIFDQIEELELHGLCLPRELGGMNCPMLLYTLTTELFARADVSVSHHHGFHGGMAVALLAYSVSEGTTEFDEEGRVVSTRFENAIEEIIAGEAWGSMDITEPGAGSDLSKLRTKGYLDEDGQWRVDGQKIWITSGHGKYHVVLARTEEDEEGLDALSTFLVQTYEEDEEGERVRHATVERLAEKMGHHASATCVVRFDETPAQLIGERGDGFRNMLLLMNNARVAVGIESVGVCEDAFRLARDYAEQRETMGKPIARHEMIADYLDEMKTEIQGMRALGIH
ncbi:MAG: acyl-CoA dehydrogenase family protein, partial [Bradymonadaceae bacterium]